MEITRKITIATVNNVRKGFKDVKALTFLARILGVVASMEVEPTGNGGAITKFVGEFRAVSQERKEFGAPVAYLPAAAETALAAAVKAGDGKPVKFAFDVFASPDSSPIGYSITANPLVEPSAMRTLDELNSSLPELPAKADLLTGQGEPGASQGETKPTGEAGSPPPAPAPSPEPQTKPAAKSAPKGGKK